MLAYSAGLRVSEVVKLKLQDIDTKRNIIHIKAAKSRKDRYTVLSEVALRVLREYWKGYQPKNWLFPVEDASQKAGVAKHVTVHTLRGIDLRYIQELLGYKSSKTTEIYTHVSQRDIGRIKSPGFWK
ncbi:MAG: hypothetical protein B5M48_04320 [Candidatus Omnitrophica bacterium 4484_213]|nr:MAG: hypothetical protein B5M48_04320 [Candidatus Omnitrophica bacterium 4484_213]